MPLIEANGCDFHYEMVGQGRDMVFIHGEIHGLEYWEHQFAEFSTDHRCFAYNRRGHAKTRWTDYGFSLVNQTRDLEQLIKRLDIDRPVIVAVAFGTTIAANYAIHHSDRVRGLVLGAWSEMHDALQYFERWERYSGEAASVLEREGRDALVALLRNHGGKSIYRVIPVESPVREKVIQMFASHPLGEYQRGMLEFGLSVPEPGAGIQQGRYSRARRLRRQGSLSGPTGSLASHDAFPRGAADRGCRPLRALGKARRVQRDSADISSDARLELTVAEQR